jgi:hypothetical protein
LKLIKAIINQIKTGSISNAITRGGSVSRPTPPYVVVYEDTPENGGDERVGLSNIVINAHFPIGNWGELDGYIYRELPILLDKVILTAVDTGRTFRLNKTKTIGPPVDGNDDNTISRERVFSTVRFF